jgi:hypothetical protein
MSAFTLRCLDQDADRISVQSTHAPTWVPERRKRWFSRPTEHDVGVTPDEVLIIKSRAVNRVEFKAHGTDLVMRSTRRATVYLPRERWKLVTLGADETLIVRRIDAKDPIRGHRVPTPDEIARGFTP